MWNAFKMFAGLCLFYVARHTLLLLCIVICFNNTSNNVLQVPAKVTHSAAHLLLSLMTTVRASFLLQLKPIQELYEDVGQGVLESQSTEVRSGASYLICICSLDTCLTPVLWSVLIWNGENRFIWLLSYEYFINFNSSCTLCYFCYWLIGRSWDWSYWSLAFLYRNSEASTDRLCLLFLGATADLQVFVFISDASMAQCPGQWTGVGHAIHKL